MKYKVIPIFDGSSIAVYLVLTAVQVEYVEFCEITSGNAIAPKLKLLGLLRAYEKNLKSSAIPPCGTSPWTKLIDPV